MGDQGCGICRRTAIEQSEVETGFFASGSPIPACRWLRRTVSLGVLGTDVVSGPMSARTECMTIRTALKFGKTLLALLETQIATFPLAFALGLSLAFALAFALAAEPLPCNHGYRVQLQGFCQRVVRLWVIARGAQEAARSVSWNSSSPGASCSPSYSSGMPSSP